MLRLFILKFFGETDTMHGGKCRIIEREKFEILQGMQEIHVCNFFLKSYLLSCFLLIMYPLINSHEPLSINAHYLLSLFFAEASLHSNCSLYFFFFILWGRIKTTFILLNCIFVLYPTWMMSLKNFMQQPLCVTGWKI